MKALGYFLTLVTCMGWVSAYGAVASKKKAETKRQGVLAGLPSTPGPHIARIKALGDGQWLKLGPPAPDPKWGHGRGRSWSHKMAYIPDAQGAIICGAGRHAYINPQGYYDDIFFYDLNAHKWIAVFPGVNTKTFGEDCKSGKYKVNADGQLVNDEVGAVPLGARSHSGQTHTYDTDARKWVYNGIAPGGVDPDWWSAKKPWFLAGKKHLKEVPDKVKNQPIYFNTVTGKFERPTGNKGRRGGGARGEVTIYLPTKKMIWTYASNTVTIGDPKTGKWTVHKKPKGAPPGSDFGACYDTKRHRIYLSSGVYRKPPGPKEGFINIYDVPTNAWLNYPNKENAVQLPSSASGMFHYDSVSDRVVIFRASKKTKTFSDYNPETQEWTAPKPLPAGMGRGCYHGFYSPEVNAHFIYIAGDSRDKGTMWVYRHKRAAK
jgi:hypothetical protein